MDAAQPSWYFPNGKNLEKISASNAAVETFKDQKIQSLAREVVQNSLDASASDKPVLVDFNLFKIKHAELPGNQQFVDEILPLAEKTWPDDEKTTTLLNKISQTIKQDEIPVLKISDFNTTGLKKENWQSLIEQTGSSVKQNDNSGGSFGIGKGAPFAASNLRMVFYNTKTPANSDQSIGLSRFVSFDLPNQNTTQGTGYFGAKENVPFNHQVKFDQNIRQEIGTDLYVMGFDLEDFPNWDQIVVLSVINNFLVAIYDHQLRVRVNGQMISKRTLPKLIEKIKANKSLANQYQDLISYYEVLADQNHLVIKMPGFAEIPLAKNEAELTLSNQTSNNRKVLMTRKKGMKIFDQDHISGILNFSGVFHATGSELNRLLKQMENPKHDQWSYERATDLKQGKELLKDIATFIQKSVVDNFQEQSKSVVDAYGINQFLPNTLNNEQKPQPKTHHQLKVVDLTHASLTPTRANAKTVDEKEEKIIAEILGENIPRRIFHQQARTTHPTKHQRLTDFSYKINQVDYQNGIYHLMIDFPEIVNNFIVTIYAVGDNDDKQLIKILTADIGEVKNGQLHFENTKKIETNMTLSIKQLLKLEVQIDENL